MYNMDGLTDGLGYS